jgi:predicted hydrocarbon binding protein
MSKSKTRDWDSLWEEYTELLRKWMQTFESLQKVSSQIQSKYNEVMLKAANESSENTLKEFHENWQKSMSDAALSAFKEFGENWQKITNQYGMEQLKAYSDIMNSFAQTWQKMWRK